MIGKQYACVGSVNLVLLAIFAVLDGLLRGFGAIFYVEYVLQAALSGLVVAHGAYFGQKLTALAKAEKRAGSAEEARTFAQKRHALQKVSLQISLLDIAISAALIALAINA